MYIKFQFVKNGAVENISEPTQTSNPTYSPSSPSAVEDLPENTSADMMVQTNPQNTDEKCYYMDCKDLDLKTVESAIRIFKDTKFGKNNDCSSQVTLTEDQILPFLQDMNQALEAAKLSRQAQSPFAKIQSYCTQRNLLFTAGAVATVGVAALAYKLAYRSE